jgi:hypothetical protein
VLAHGDYGLTALLRLSPFFSFFFSTSIVSLAPEGRVKRREPEEGREAIIPVYRHYPKSV